MAKPVKAPAAGVVSLTDLKDMLVDIKGWNLKDRSSRPPDWRWQVANLVMQNNQDINMHEDFELFRLVKQLQFRALTFDNGKTAARMEANMVYSDVVRAIDIYQKESVGYACTRHALEACILAGANVEDIRRIVDKSIRSNVILYYKAFFFDLPKRCTKFWYEKYIFSPARKLSDEMRISGYIWKAIAYAYGLERLEKSCLEGTEYDDKDDAWIIKACVRSSRRQALQCAHEEFKVNNITQLASKEQQLNTLCDNVVKERQQVAAAEATTQGAKGDVGQLIEALSANAVKYAGVHDPLKPPETNGAEKYDGIPRYTDNDIQKMLDNAKDE